ncbi:MAG: multiheme c-type cytochrome [Isosphaeraceae bacterium]
MGAFKLARSRIGVWVGASLLVLASVAGVFWLVRDKADHVSGSQDVSTIDSTASSAGRGTGREDARAALRDGRFDAALAFYRSLDASAFEVEDFATLGRTLLERDRLILGWTALEAARRIDPKHGPTNRALEGFQAKLADGREPTKTRDAAGVVDFLRGVRGGPALGLLVLGLARFAGDRDHEQDFLDRLLVRDRAVMRAVTTPADALKLLARLLMETGRPAEAGDLLRPLLAGAGDFPAEPGAGINAARPGRAGVDNVPGRGAGTQAGTGARSPTGPAPDRETAWLLSRVALQLDQHETADAMLALASGFGTGDKPSPEPAPYIGSRRCEACHPAIYQAQQKESAHAKTLYHGADLKEVPLPAKPLPDPVAAGATHQFSRLADDRIELKTRVKDQTYRAVIEYAVGSGRHGITMVGKDEVTGLDRELRVSYFSHDQSWGKTKGTDFLPQESGDYIGLELSARGLNVCLNCHTTWFRSANPIPSLAGPETLDQGIGCERCHGPGLNHDKAIASGFAEMAIAQTRKSPPRQLLQSCQECHASNGSVDPSDPEFTRVQGTTLMFSRCFNATGGGIHCATCHDPHRDLDTTPSHYDVKCLGCHTAPASRPGPSSSAQPTAICPVNPAADCTSCHMPKVQDPSLRTSFTDHHIRVHKPAGG